MHTGQLIRHLRKSKGLSQEELGEIVGVQKSAIAKYENGRVKNLKRDTIEKLANYFDINPSLLILGIDGYLNDIDNQMKDIDNQIIKKTHQADKEFIENLISVYDSTKDIKLPSPSQVVYIPIYDNASCGLGSFVDDDIIDYVSLPIDLFKNPNSNLFGQYAQGDSMIGLGINDGDLLIFEETQVIENGEIGCFCLENNIATCKKFSIDSKNNIFLLSANDNYPPIPITIENDCFRVVGRYVTRIPKEM